jgi:hypothetical protein
MKKIQNFKYKIKTVFTFIYFLKETSKSFGSTKDILKSCKEARPQVDHTTISRL